jgi:hypothetical protein
MGLSLLGGCSFRRVANLSARGSAGLASFFFGVHAQEMGLPSASARFARARVTGQLLDSDYEDSDDDDETPFSGFFRAMHNGHAGIRISSSPFAPIAVATHYRTTTTTTTTTSRTTRSYARNANDATAGLSNENPLEIEDSDDEVEIIEVSRSTRV